MNEHTNWKKYHPYVGPFDPCRPIKTKYYVTPPNLYMGFQPPNLPQYSPKEALYRGTLWPALFSPYSNPYELGREENSGG